MQSLTSFRTPPHRKTMGIEIECLLLKEIPITRHYKFWYATYDGSISTAVHSRQQGIEFVSQPLTPDWLIKEINRLPKIINQEWTWNASCGIHIHVSRQWLTPKKATEIYRFLNKLWEECPEQYIEAFGRRPNGYCEVSGILGGSRYKAINTLNANTIEFRMFSSGGTKWAVHCVRTAKYLVDHAHHLNIDAFDAFVSSSMKGA